MDEQVRQGMARWPNVPAMYGWLRLDRRGHWFLIDRNVDGFDESQHGRGSPITSPPIIDFIARNYEQQDGRWYWQNGPQRVFVDLDLAPLVYRVLENARGQALISHCGDRVDRIDAAASTAAGDLWLLTPLGPGVVHDLDLALLALEFDERSERVAGLRLNGNTIAVEGLGEGVPEPDWARFDARPRQRSDF